MKTNRFEGKIAVISGASSGIGKAIADRLQNLGIKIINVSKNLNEENTYFKNFKCDISNDESLKDVCNQIFEISSKIDYLFCNAGFGIGGAIENASFESIQSIFDVNLVSHIKMTKLFIPHMVEDGRILFTCSAASFIPLPYQACYSASKAGLESFARALATEVRDKKIKVSAIMPGDTRTAFTDARVKETNNGDKELKGINKMEKWERNGKSPEYVAKVVEKTIKKKHPPVRVCVDMQIKFFAFLTKIFPNKFIDYLVRKIYI